MKLENIQTSAVILLAETEIPGRYLFGAYKDNGKATGFVDLPEDHKRFVEILTDQQTIMGRKTLEATPKDFPDAGRIVVTHHPKKIKSPGLGVESLESAIELAKKRALKEGKKEVFVVGGARIMQECIENNLLDKIQLTLTYSHQENIPNPVYLSFELDNWKIEEDSGILTSENSKPKNLKYRYLVLG